jgi:hypothetical protein
MSYSNTKCPCGGKKETETMLCEDCTAAFEIHDSLRHDLASIANDSHGLCSRRTSAMRLVLAAHRRKAKGLPLEYQF